MNYQQIEVFIKSQVEEYFKLRGLTQYYMETPHSVRVEEYFKLRGLTPTPDTPEKGQGRWGHKQLEQIFLKSKIIEE